MRLLETDVLIVGSGLAGVLAAIRAARLGCRVLLTSKVSIRSGNSTYVGGGWIIPSGDFSAHEYFRFVMEGGKQLNDPKLVQILSEKAESRIKALREMGIPVEKANDKYWYIKKGTESKTPGSILMDGLMTRVEEEEQIKTLPWTPVLELLLEEGEISGALGFSKQEGPLTIHAKSVVLATGGAGYIYKRSDNYKGILGDGYSLALRLGLTVKDMEFVQFYPLGLAEPHLPSVIAYPPIPEEARIINSKGEDLFLKFRSEFHVQETILEYGINTNRDQFTLFLAQELEQDRVYLDYTQLPEKKWERWFQNRLARMDPSFRNRPFSVAPVAHFFMGGVEIDEETRTSIPGLFAAGEVTAGVHGANREGGNALTECIVLGDIAGESAARYAKKRSATRVRKASIGPEYHWKKQSEKELNLFKEVQDLTWKHAGPIRDGKSLEEGLSKLADIEERLRRLESVERSVALNEVKSSLLVSKAIIRASLERKESRGAFYRRDFPKTDDINWRKNIILRLDPETLDFSIIT